MYSTLRDMALVEYSDSDSGSEPSRCSQRSDCPGAVQSSPARRLVKRKRDEDDLQRRDAYHAHPRPLPPPLPAGFHDLYGSGIKTSVIDDPTLHGGRQRLTPHVQGNWATHIYLECKYSVNMTIDHHSLWRMPSDGYEGFLHLQNRSDSYN